MDLPRFGRTGVFLITDIGPLLLKFVDNFIFVVRVLIISVEEIVLGLVLRLVSIQLIPDFFVGQALRNPLLGRVGSLLSGSTLGADSFILEYDPFERRIRLQMPHYIK